MHEAPCLLLPLAIMRCSIVVLTQNRWIWPFGHNASNLFFLGSVISCVQVDLYIAGALAEPPWQGKRHSTQHVRLPWQMSILPLIALSCGTRTRSLLVLLYWPLSKRPRPHEGFILIGICWLYGLGEFPPPELTWSFWNSKMECATARRDDPSGCQHTY